MAHGTRTKSKPTTAKRVEPPQRSSSHYYIASAFIPGGSLAAELRPGKGIEIRRAARLVKKLAEALAYAHGKGVVHRDVKPANVMLDEQGEPLLLDFGLAARPDEAEKLTQEGVKVMGTPAYMAPEQAEGEGQPLSDQYSLGCTLYELLTGQTPFTGPPELQLFLHRTWEPASPRKLRPQVPRDLETVCLKCLSKAPGRRFASAELMALDLQQFLDGKPIVARPVGGVERAWRWSRRNPVGATLAAAAAVLLVIASVFLGVNVQLAVEGDELRDKAQSAVADQGAAQEKLNEAIKESAAKQEAQKKKDRDARRQAYPAHMRTAWLALEGDNLAEARDLLNRHLPTPGQPDYRCWEWYYLDAMLRQTTIAIKAHEGPPGILQWSPDGRLLVSSSLQAKGAVKVWDAETGHMLGSLSLDRVQAIAWSPDSQSVAVVTWGDPTYGTRGLIWAFKSGKRVELDFPKPQQLRGYQGPPFIAWAPDGASVLCLYDAHAPQLYDTRTGALIRTFHGHRDRVSAAAWSPYGQLLATGSFDKTIKLWDVPTGQEIHELGGYNHKLGFLTWSPDGHRLAAAGLHSHGFKGEIRIWHVNKGIEQVMQCDMWPNFSDSALFWTISGKHLCFFQESAGHRSKIWETGTWKELASVHETPIALSPDGRRLVSAITGGSTLKVIDFETKKEQSGLEGFAVVERTKHLVWNPDGTRLAASSTSGRIKIWNSVNDHILRSTLPDASPSVGWTSDSRSLRTVEKRSRIVVWDLARAKEVAQNWGTEQHVWAEAWSRDGTKFAVSIAGAVEMVDTVTGKSRLLGKLLAGAWLAWSPDGQWLASANHQQVELWHLPSAKMLTLVDARNTARKLASYHHYPLVWSPDGKKLVTEGEESAILIWDAAAAKVVHVLRGHTAPVLAAAWSPDGKRLVSAGADKLLKVWDVGQNKALHTLSTGPVRHLAWSPDGQRVASAGAVPHPTVKEITLWDTHDWKALGKLPGFMGPITWSPDGKCLVADNMHDGITVVRPFELTARNAAPQGALSNAPGRGSMKFKAPKPGGAEMMVEALLSGPLIDTAKELLVYYIPSKDVHNIKPDGQGRWPVLAGAKAGRLKLHRGRAVGSFASPFKDEPNAILSFQPAYLDLNGKTIVGPPGAFIFRLQPEALAKNVEPDKAPNKEDRSNRTVTLQLINGRTSVKGELNKTDLQASRIQCYYKVYTIRLNGGTTYEIDMKSTDIWAALRLEDGAGKQLAEHDGTRFNGARMRFKCPEDGNYHIIATSFLARETGSFSLTVAAIGKSQLLAPNGFWPCDA
jgi:WD40 repeat protein